MHLRSKELRDDSARLRSVAFRIFLLLFAVFSMLQICNAQSHQTASAVPMEAASAGSVQWPTIRQDVQFTEGKSVINGLTSNQVHVVENGSEQSGISLEQRDQASSICIVLDRSSSMNKNRPVVIDAIRRLIASSNPADEFELISFNGHVFIDQPFTTDTRKLDALLDTFEFKGGSDLFDAIAEAISRIETRPSARHAIVIFSDGEDNFSRVSAYELGRILKHPGMPLIYSLSPFAFTSPGVDTLSRLSRTAGGFSLLAMRTDPMNKEAEEVAKDIRSRYSLEYASAHTQRDGKLRKVEINIAPGISASKIKPLFRQEYYAPSH